MLLACLLSRCRVDRIHKKMKASLDMVARSVAIIRSPSGVLGAGRPHSCTHRGVPWQAAGGDRVVINVAASDGVRKLEDGVLPIVRMTEPGDADEDAGGAPVAYHCVAVHTAVMERAMTDAEFQMAIVESVMHNLERADGVRFLRPGVVRPEPLVRSRKPKRPASDPPAPPARDAATSSPGPPPSPAPEDLMAEIGKFVHTRAAGGAAPDAEEAPAIRIPGPVGAAARAPRQAALIQEVEADAPATPVYSMCVVRNGSAVRVRVELPMVATVADVDLDVSAADLRLSAGCGYALSVRFPEPVSADSAHAKFSKRKRVLTVTVPIRKT